MAQAVDAFLATAAGSARQGTLSLGWTLRIKLGAGLSVPPSANAPSCRAWESDGAPADYFGWNSVGRNMALYYMTGDERFLREFLRLAFPDKKTIEGLREVDGERIENKEHPLAGSYHYCLNIEKLRIGQTTLLQSNEHNNTVIARRQGLIAAELPLESALKVHKVVGDVAHVEAEVPKFGYGVWRRAVLHAKGRWTVVADQLTARQDAPQLEMRVQWSVPAAARLAEEGYFEYAADKSTAVVVPATQTGLRVGTGLAQCTVRRDLKAGEKLEMITLLGRQPPDARHRLSCARLTDSAAMLSVPGPGTGGAGAGRPPPAPGPGRCGGCPGRQRVHLCGRGPGLDLRRAVAGRQQAGRCLLVAARRESRPVLP